jgi:hypothetical protein
MAAISQRGESMDISLIGFRSDHDLGGPPGISSGDSLPGEGEAVVDESLADRYGLGIGDYISVVGHPLKVVGISEGGNFVFWRAVFVDYAEGAVVKQKEFATFLLFKLREPCRSRVR